MTRWGPRLAIAVATITLGRVAGVARGHIVYGRPSLLTLVGGAERVAHVRIVDPATVADDGTRPVSLGDVYTVVER